MCAAGAAKPTAIFVRGNVPPIITSPVPCFVTYDPMWTQYDAMRRERYKILFGPFEKPQTHTVTINNHTIPLVVYGPEVS